MADLERMVRLFVTKTCISKGIDSHAAKQREERYACREVIDWVSTSPMLISMLYVSFPGMSRGFFHHVVQDVGRLRRRDRFEASDSCCQSSQMNLVFRDIEIDLIMARLPVEQWIRIWTFDLMKF